MKKTLSILSLAAASISVAHAADEYWKVDGTTGTWTSTNWSLTGSAPYATGWTAANNAIFNANSLITYVTTTSVANITVADGATVTMTAAGTYNPAGVRTLTVGTGSVLDFAGQNISTSVGNGFVKAGPGIFYSGNGNGYVGGFTLNAGTIVLGGINAMGAGALNINGGTIAASATRNITARYTSVSIGGDFTLGGVTTGVTTANGSATANITFADAMNLGAATRAITVGSNGVYTLGGALSGAAGTGLTVNAASGATGRLVLTSGSNTYNGTTTVSSGATLAVSAGGIIGSGNLVANGTFDISAITPGSYILSSTQALSGSGTLALGAKELSVAGAFGPGNSPGTLTTSGAGAFTLTSTAASTFEVNGTTTGLFDRLNATGATLNLNGTLNIVTGYAAALNDSVDLLDWTTLNGTFSSITGTNIGGGLQWDTSALYTTGVITAVAVPKPSTYVMLLGGLGASILLFRRKRAL